jgi:hypothetical protein
MQTYLSRIAWALILLVLGTSCGGEPRLWVRLAEWPVGAETLHVVPWINGVPQKEITVPNGTPGFVITLPEGTIAEIRLQITALDGELCKVGTAEVTEALGPALRLTHEQEVQIEMLDGGPVCTLSLEFPSDVSVVRSTPPGLVCPTGSVRCEAEFPKGSVIEFELGFEPHKYSKVSASEASCTEQGTCSISLAKSKSSEVTTKGRTCSTDGFCLYELANQNGMLFGVWGIDANNVWAVGAGGTVLKWDGKVWTPQENRSTDNLYSVWGSDANNVWAVGTGGTVLKWDGSGWLSNPKKTSQTLRGVWGSDNKHVWAVGYGGTILNWNGEAWATQANPDPDMEDLNAIWGNNANNVWAVGGTILNWNGDDWKLVPSPFVASLYGVWGSGLNKFWAVGFRFVIFQWNGSEWIDAQYDRGSGYGFNGIWGSDENNIWAIGESNTIVRGGVGGWPSRSTGTEKNSLRGVWGSSARDIWVVGASGTILRRKQ